MQRHEYGQKWNHVWGGGEVRRWFPSEMVTQSPEGGDLTMAPKDRFPLQAPLTSTLAR